MPKKVERLHWPDAPDVWAPFVPVIKVTGGSLVFLAGMTAAKAYHSHPHRPEEFDEMPTDMEGQAREIFRKMKISLDTVGGALSDVVAVTRFLKDVNQQDALNAVWAENFGDHRPTTTTVEVVRMTTDPRCLVEVTAIAVVD